MPYITAGPDTWDKKETHSQRVRLFCGLHTGSAAQLQIDLSGFRYLPDVGVHRAAAAAHGLGSRPHPPVGVVPEGDAVPAAVPGLGGGIVLLAAVGVDRDRQGSGTFQLPDEVLHKLGRCAVDAIIRRWG